MRALCQQFDEAVTAVCLEYIGSMVQLYQSNPAGWKSKDAAIALMLAVTVRAESAAKGASMLNERVDVMSFFTSHVLPELEDANVNARPIIKADCIKFITTFRQVAWHGMDDEWMDGWIHAQRRAVSPPDPLPHFPPP